MLGGLDERLGGDVDGRAALLERPRAHRAHRPAGTRSVSPQITSIWSIGMPVLGRGDHRPRRDVTLPVRGGAGVDDGAAVLAELDAGVLVELGRAARDLDVHAHADAELLGVARWPGGPPARRAGRRSRRRRARCRAPSRSRRRRTSGRWSSCAARSNLGIRLRAAHVDGVHADLGREQVHGPLDGRRRLGSPGTAVGDDGRGVGDDGRGVALDLGDGVDARRHRPRHERRQDRADLHHGAAVLEHPEPVGEHLPSRLPPRVMCCTCARPWPRATIDSLRVSRQLTGRPSSFDEPAQQLLLGVACRSWPRSRRRRPG